MSFRAVAHEHALEARGALVQPAQNAKGDGARAALGGEAQGDVGRVVALWLEPKRC
jgi:hypothetical protein